MKNNHKWTTDELLYIIYKHGMVIQLGQEEKFVDSYFSDEAIEASGKSRQELLELFAEMNEIIFEEIETYYADGLTMADVMQAEADKYDMEVVELFKPFYALEELH